jgi:hypothetical protein
MQLKEKFDAEEPKDISDKEEFVTNITTVRTYGQL